MMIELPVQVKPNSETIDDIQTPAYMTDGAAGMDIYSANRNDIVIKQNQVVAIPTGLHFAIPLGYEMQIRPRSGLVLKHQLTVLNSPGTIDSDYRGELRVILGNFGEDFTVTPKMRIAQAVICPVVQANLQVVAELSSTDRGEGGFGSTGK